MNITPTLRSVLGLAVAAGTLGLVPTGAHAAPGSDLRPNFIVATSTRVNDVSHYDVRVTNTGTKHSGATTLTIDLPATATSPTVHVKGTLSNVHTWCTRSGTRLTCALGVVPRGSYRQVGFDIQLPYSVTPMTFTANVTTTNDINTSNNSATRTAVQTFYTVPVAPVQNVTVSHCTGTALTSFHECLLYPSSISSHSTTLVAGTSPGSGTIDFVALNGAGFASYGGTWSLAGTQLTMQYTDNGLAEVDYVGQGSLANCWDGRATFVGSTYVAMYRVCV